MFEEKIWIIRWFNIISMICLEFDYVTILKLINIQEKVKMYIQIYFLNLLSIHPSIYLSIYLSLLLYMYK